VILPFLLSNRIDIVEVNEVIDLFSKLVYINIPQSDNIINVLLIEQVCFVELDKKLLPPFRKTIC
jgi:transposase